jgi:hypothetical protein
MSEKLLPDLLVALNRAVNYIDALGGDSREYRRRLAAIEQNIRAGGGYDELIESLRDHAADYAELEGAGSSVVAALSLAASALLANTKPAAGSGEAVDGYLYTSEEVSEAMALLRRHRSAIVMEAIDEMERCLRNNADDGDTPVPAGSEVK